MADKKSQPSPTQDGPSAAAEAADKIKSTVTKLPKWEKMTFFGGLAYLVAIFLPYMQVKGLKELSSYMSNKYNYSWSIYDSGGIWFFLALAVGLISVIIPFIKMIAKNFKLPFPKEMIYFSAGIVGALVPILRWILLKSKDNYTFDYGFFILVAAGALIAFGGQQVGGLKMLQDKIQQAKKSSPSSSEE